MKTLIEDNIPGATGGQLGILDLLGTATAPITISGVQAELQIWQAHNFPSSPPEVPLLGIVEELGELENATTIEDRIDAIGDAGIFLCDYCNRFDISITQILKGSVLSSRHETKLAAIGMLAHAHIKGSQSIRHTPAEIDHLRRVAVWQVVNALCFQAASLNRYFSDCLLTTWEQVRTRDWKKFPADGRTK